MSDLQIALAAVGGLMVAAVWIYNNWQERKHLKAAEDIFKSGQSDALLTGNATTSATSAAQRPIPEELMAAPARLEPHLSNDVDDAVQTSKAHASPPVTAYVPPVMPAPMRTPVVNEAAPAAASPSASRLSSAGSPATLPPLPAQWADSIADCILRFNTPEPIEAHPVWQAQLPWAADISKPVHWLVFEPAGSLGGAWRSLGDKDRGAYTEWAISLQLVNRQGPVSEDELALFLNGAQKFVRQMGGAPLTLPDRAETLSYAEKLDRFCADVDIQFSLHIVEASGGSFAGTKLRSVAEAAGLVLEADGVFRARDIDSVELFTLGNMGEPRLAVDTIKSLSTPGLTVTLDVPRVADGPVAFDRLLTTARQLSKTLGGVLVDAQRAPLGAPMINGIRAKSGELQKRMRDGGIAPGSVRAARLFS